MHESADVCFLEQTSLLLDAVRQLLRRHCPSLVLLALACRFASAVVDDCRVCLVEFASECLQSIVSAAFAVHARRIGSVGVQHERLQLEQVSTVRQPRLFGLQLPDSNTQTANGLSYILCLSFYGCLLLGRCLFVTVADSTSQAVAGHCQLVTTADQQ